jgi:hypothetical protein
MTEMKPSCGMRMARQHQTIRQQANTHVRQYGNRNIVHVAVTMSHAYTEQRNVMTCIGLLMVIIPTAHYPTALQDTETVAVAGIYLLPKPACICQQTISHGCL